MEFEMQALDVFQWGYNLRNSSRPVQMRILIEVAPPVANNDPVKTRDRLFINR
jgi:hypothetical protein